MFLHSNVDKAVDRLFLKSGFLWITHGRLQKGYKIDEILAKGRRTGYNRESIRLCVLSARPPQGVILQREDVYYRDITFITV